MNRCTCQPGARCDYCSRVSYCIRRMQNLVPIRPWPPGSVEHADMVTSLCDARAALSITLGLPLALIDASSGHALTPAGGTR